MLPSDTVVHLFGAKGNALPALAAAGLGHRVGGTDSMAWDASVRRAMPIGRTQVMRARAMLDWHARETRRLHERVRREAVLTCAAPLPRKDPLEVATEAVGAAFGDLHGGNEIDYLDARHLMAKDVALVAALVRSRGADAFEEEDPDDDFGLGMVYERVRAALLEAGYLAVRA